MKTCETCQGTGQVAEPIKAGDIVENPSGGLGVAVSEYVNRVLDSEYPRAKDDIRYILISGGAKAWGTPGGTYTADPKTLTVRHGHIHIDR